MAAPSDQTPPKRRPKPHQNHSDQTLGIAGWINELLNGNTAEFLNASRRDAGFDEIANALYEVRSTIETLQELPYKELSFELVRELYIAVSDIGTRIKEMAAFDAVALADSEKSPSAERRRLIREFQESLNAFWQRIAPVLGVLALQHAMHGPQRDVAVIINESRGVLKDLTSIRDTAQATLSSAQSLASKVGVETYAEIFRDAAVRHGKSGTKWLIATAVLAAATAGLLALDVYRPRAVDPLASTGSITLMTTARIALYSLCVSAVLWCGRAYRASRHNQIVNEHRMNALNSFTTFWGSANEPSIKEAVLLHAAQSIFLPQATGFGGSDSEGSAPTSVIEILRNSAQTK